MDLELRKGKRYRIVVKIKIVIIAFFLINFNKNSLRRIRRV